MKKKTNDVSALDINAVQSRMLTIRGQQVLLDRDVAALYGVETKALNRQLNVTRSDSPRVTYSSLTEMNLKIGGHRL